MPSIIELDLQEDKIFNTFKAKLTKPNGKKIDSMKTAYGFKLVVEKGKIHTLDFRVPKLIDNGNHVNVNNPLLDKIKLGFQVHIEFKGMKEIFIIMEDSKLYSKDETYVDFKLKSLPYRLSKYPIRDFVYEAEMLTPMLQDALLETTWKVGSIDPSFDLAIRSISITSSTVLQVIFELATKFGAIPDFDSENRTVSMLRVDELGINRGLVATEHKYIEDYTLNNSFEDIVTVLTCYGEEGLDFRNLSPTGSNTLSDYSYFMYPFECDENYNVIRSSAYGMSDDLCIALTKYDKKVKMYEGVFAQLLVDKENKQTELFDLEEEMVGLVTERKQLEEELDLINLTYMDTAKSRPDWVDVNIRLDAKLLEIEAKQAEIDSVELQLDDVEQDITNMVNDLSMVNNFTSEQLFELNDGFRYEQEFTDTSIINSKDLLEAGKQVFEKLREPKFTLNFGMVDFTNDFQFKSDRKKIRLGDLITFKSRTYGTKIRARILKIEYDIDNLDAKITLSNDIEKLTDEDIVAETLKNASYTSKAVDINMYKIEAGKHADTMVEQILNSAFDTTKNILIGGYENTNEMTERGFYSRDFQYPDSTYLVINGGMLAITQDGGRSVEVAITKDGVHARRLVGSIILGNKLLIESESGIVTIENETITIKDDEGNHLLSLGRYELDGEEKHGLYIRDGAIDLRTSDNENRGMQMDADGLRAYNNNGVKTFEIDAKFGDLFFMGNIESSTITGSTVQTNSLPNRGIKMNDDGLSLYRPDGTRTVFLDARTGDATFTGTINASTIIGGNISGTTLTGSTITGNTITGGTINGTDIIGTNITGSIIDGGEINGTTINGGTINGGTINVDTDVNIGDNIYLGDESQTTQKGVHFNLWSQITSNGRNMNLTSESVNIQTIEDIMLDSNWIQISATDRIDMYGEVNIYDNLIPYGTVDFSSANVIGLDDMFIGTWTPGVRLGYNSSLNRLYVNYQNSEIGWIEVVTG